MGSKPDLKNYICEVPFTSLEIHDHQRFLCCASWLTKFLPEDTKPIEESYQTICRECVFSIFE